MPRRVEITDFEKDTRIGDVIAVFTEQEDGKWVDEGDDNNPASEPYDMETLFHEIEATLLSGD